MTEKEGGRGQRREGVRNDSERRRKERTIEGEEGMEG